MFENKTSAELKLKNERMWEQVKQPDSSLNQFCKWIGVKNIGDKQNE